MLRRDARTRELGLILLLICSALLIYNASYWDWTGADAVGPRHLISILPFLSLPIIFVVNAATKRWHRAGFILLVGLSISEVWIQSLAGQALPPETVGQPILDYALPLVRDGQLRFSVGTVLGLRGLTAVLPLVVLLIAIVWCVPRVESLCLRRRRR
jgi:hypothetical protein